MSGSGNLICWKRCPRICANNTSTISSSPSYLILLVFIILMSQVHFTNAALPLSSYWSLRKRVVEVESSIDTGQTVEQFQILNFTWESKDFPKEGIRGNVIIAEPLDACEAVEPPPDGMFDEDNNETNWFLLANNDGCDITTKQRNANESGFLALILPNNFVNNSSIIKGCVNESDCVEEELSLFTEDDEFLPINIYSLRLEDNDWLLLRQNFSYPNPYTVKIQDKSAIIVFSIVIGFLILVLITIFTLCVISIKQLLSTIGECTRKREILRQNNLLIATVSSLPSRKWTRELDTLSEENKVCKICMENFQDDEEIRVLPCCHIYHMVCVDQWILDGRPFCQICKQMLVRSSERITPRPNPMSEPTYPSYESTRLLISNQRSPETSTDPPVMRVMAVMPEVFDASFEAMLPLRTAILPAEMTLTSPSENSKDCEITTNEENQNIPGLPYESQETLKVGDSSASNGVEGRQSRPAIENSKIYISNHEHFV